MRDKYNRTIDYARISVIDKCNFKCTYCIPEGMTETVNRSMDYNEIIALARALAEVGVKKIKITGGEPLLRKDIIKIIKEIKRTQGIEQVTLTTNGYFLEKYLDELYEAKIDGINISMDAVDKKLFYEITGVDRADEIIRGIQKTQRLGMQNIKINCVLIKGCNESQYLKLVQFAMDYDICVKFIEMMPIGEGKHFEGYSLMELKECIESHYGNLVELEERYGNGPAIYYRLNNRKEKIGFIGAMTHKFCDRCNRIRITSEGFLKTCLQYSGGIDLRPHLFEGDLAKIIKDSVQTKQESHKFKALYICDGEHKSMAQIGG